MICVLASIKVKTGERARFIQAFKANVPAVLAENGCIEYFPTVDIASGIDIQQSDPDVVTIVEKWENLSALKAHLTAPHMLAYRENVKNMVENTTLKVIEPV